MQNKKNNRIIAVVIISILMIVGGIYFIINYTKDENSLSVVEKKWITDNLNTIVDVNVYNDIPLYGYNGSGVSLDFLNSFTEEYNIKFNKIPYYSNDIDNYKDISFRILNNNEKIGDNDILFYTDHYVAVSLKNNDLIELDELSNIGILSSVKDMFVDYFGDEVKIKSYDSIDLAINGILNEEVNYLVIPNVMYMNEIISNDLNIVLHINDFNYKYVLNVKDDVAYSVISKYYSKYLRNDYMDNYSRVYLDSYFSFSNTSDLDVKNYNAKIYKYGYVVNMPYENYTTSNFVGTLSNYLMDFERVANVEIEVLKYDSIDELKSALVSGDIDFSLTNFDYDVINMKNITTSAFSDCEYVVLSYDNIVINDIKGLRDYKVNVIGSSNLHYLCIENNISTNVFLDSDDLIRNITLDDIVIVDRYTYEYYKNEKLSDYKVVYSDKLDSAYRFIVGEADKAFAGLFNYYISSRNYADIRYDYNTDIMLRDDNNNLMFVVLVIVVIVGSIIGLVLFNRKTNKSIKLSREERIKYIDPVTSLKNRNYLNHNIYTWDDNVIFPQSIIVMDINSLREINDKYGREIGDEVIKKVASILIDNQMENTDIIRSGGDEFIIYMIGYEENDVLEYAKKMVKKMKDIPNSHGVEMGYSMIIDEVKTVDDAINESVGMMKKNKDKNKSN